MFGIIEAPIKMTGASLSLGIAGEAFNSEGLSDAGTSASKFIAPAVNISAGGYLLKQLKKFKKL